MKIQSAELMPHGTDSNMSNAPRRFELYIHLTGFGALCTLVVIMSICLLLTLTIMAVTGKSF